MKTETFTVRLTQDQRKRVHALSEVYATSDSSMIRIIIDAVTTNDVMLKALSEYVGNTSIDAIAALDLTNK